MDQIPNDPMDPCMHKRFVQVESYACPARITIPTRKVQTFCFTTTFSTEMHLVQHVLGIGAQGNRHLTCIHRYNNS